jgi:hypothetical protein
MALTCCVLCDVVQKRGAVVELTFSLAEGEAFWGSNVSPHMERQAAGKSRGSARP